MNVPADPELRRREQKMSDVDTARIKVRCSSLESMGLIKG